MNGLDYLEQSLKDGTAGSKADEYVPPAPQKMPSWWHRPGTSLVRLGDVPPLGVEFPDEYSPFVSSLGVPLTPERAARAWSQKKKRQSKRAARHG